MAPQILIYALAKGDTERWKENLISERCKTADDVQRVKAAAASDGWHSFRVTTWDGSPPNFAAAINS